jgi:uncharacterized protein (DUF362 family)
MIINLIANVIAFIIGLFRRYHVVRIVYKSGHTETFRVTEYSVSTLDSTGEISSIKLKGIHAKDSLFLGINNIESIVPTLMRKYLAALAALLIAAKAVDYAKKYKAARRAVRNTINDLGGNV